MTKIVFLTHSAAPAGAELALFASLDAYKGGHDVSVVFGEDGDVVRKFEAAGLKHVVLPMHPSLAGARRRSSRLERVGQVGGVLRYARELRKLLRVEAPEVVVGRSLKAVIYGRLATIGTGTAFVWCLHDRLSTDYLGRTAFLWSRGLVRLVDGLVVNSQSTLETVRPGKRPVLVLPPATGLRPPERQPREEDAPLRVLCLSRLSPWKGQDLAIKAFAATLAPGGAVLTVAGAALFGEEEYAQSLRTLAAGLGLKQQVRFVGHLEDPAAELAASDVLLHCSRIPEPFGLVVVEALRAGCVVIATAPGGPAEVIDDGISGVLASANDPRALAAALRSVGDMTNGERAAMRSAGKRRAAMYEPATLVDRQMSWLASLTARESMPRITLGGPA